MTHHYFHNKYLIEAQKLLQIQSLEEKSFSQTSPSNIALIKYWGKHGNQHPNNPSISFTLTKSCTQMSVVCQPIRDKTCSLEFYLDGIRNPEFEKKLIFYLERLLPYLPFLDALHLVVKSNNTFPHSAGIASSASSVSALALCLCSLEKEYFGTLLNVEDFLQKASFLARIGSGSACRSIFGGIALWGFVPGIANSTDELAIPIQEPVHPIFASYHDAILVIDSSPKSLSSSSGHKLMNHHAYKETRYKQASDNLHRLMAVLSSGDELKFAQIIENEALSLHGLLMSSTPGYILMHPNTLVVLNRIKEFRAQTNLPLTFTLDAGPNVHLLYPENIRTQIISFIESDLKQFCEKGFWIDDQVSSVSTLANKHMEPRIFPSKILLFGEYVILLQGKALVMPYSHFSASLQFAGLAKFAKDIKAQFSNEVLQNFYQFISKLPELKYNIDLKRFQSDLEKGLYIDSTIPVGYGLGSSGAVTAAIFDQYCLIREEVNNGDEDYLLHLKKILSEMESFFHFNSSGIDPLVCYCNKPLLYEENKVELLNFSLTQPQICQVALIDTGIPHKAHNLVEQFINNCMDNTYLTSIKNNIIIPSNNCIDALLEGNGGKFFRNLSDLSASQFNYFRPMIVPSLEAFWKQSFQTDYFVLKLCGSGGGGYLLAFVKNYDAFNEVLKQYNLSALMVD